MNVATRAYNQLELDHVSSTVTKSSDNDRIKDEVRYYLNLPEHMEIFFPRVLEGSAEEGYIIMEKYDYPNLGDFMLARQGPLLSEQWTKVMMKLKEILSIWNNVDSKHNGLMSSDTFSMYISKTLSENEAFRLQMVAPEFYDNDEIVVNGEVIRTFDNLWNDGLNKCVFDLTCNAKPGYIHGDLCFSNILLGPNGTIRFVDPRGRFGVLGHTGDIRYDIAKLMHSVDGGYEFFNNDQFRVSSDDEGWYWDYGFENPHAWEQKMSAMSAFADVILKDYDVKQIKIIQGLIFVGACARHYENLDRQRAMYLCGLQILNQAMRLA